MKTAFATMLVTSSGDPSPPNPAVTHPTPSHVVLAVGRLPAPLGMQSEAHFARESAKQLEQSKVHATMWRRRATSPSPAGKTRRCQVHYFWSSAQVLSEFRNQRMQTSVSSTARKRLFQTRLTAGLRHAPSLWHRVCGAPNSVPQRTVQFGTSPSHRVCGRSCGQEVQGSGEVVAGVTNISVAIGSIQWPVRHVRGGAQVSSPSEVHRSTYNAEGNGAQTGTFTFTPPLVFPPTCLDDLALMRRMGRGCERRGAGEIGKEGGRGRACQGNESNVEAYSQY